MKADELMVGDIVLRKGKPVEIVSTSDIEYSFGQQDITIEKLMERNIISFVYDKQLPPTKVEEQGNKMVFTIHSDFFGIRQGAYIVRPNGERVEIDYQVLANTRQDFIDYSRQGT